MEKERKVKVKEKGRERKENSQMRKGETLVELEVT